MEYGDHSRWISVTESFYGKWKRQKELGQSDQSGDFWMRPLRGKGGNWVTQYLESFSCFHTRNWPNIAGLCLEFWGKEGGAYGAVNVCIGRLN